MSPTLENQEETEALSKFRDATKDLRLEDETLIRFLRARELDLSRAEEMLRKHVEWRETKNVDSYLKYQPPSIMSESFYFEIGPPDHDGRPVIWVPMGSWNPKPVFDGGMKEECARFRLFLFESVREAVKGAGATQVFCVMGLENLTYDKIANLETMHLLYSSLKELEANYPEILKTCVVLNAPWIFSMAYNFFKPIFSKRTLNKLKIFDSDRTKWFPALLEHMPLESIPKAYR